MMMLSLVVCGILMGKYILFSAMGFVSVKMEWMETSVKGKVSRNAKL